jgi:hypothetical protein
VSGNQAVQRVAEGFIRASCRRLPEEQRADYCREWSAELPAILGDPSVRLPVQRAVRALRYSAGISSTTWHLRGAGRSARRARAAGWREGALPVRPAAPGARLAIGVLIWLVFVFAAISLLRAFPQPHPGWPFVIGGALAAGFDAFCLTNIVRASQVRYLPKWAWALICLAEFPGGGIVYLCVGRPGRARTAPPSAAGHP